MLEGGEWRKPGPCCGGARTLAAARAFPLLRDQRRRLPPRPVGTGLRGLASLGASARRSVGCSRLGCPGGHPTPPLLRGQRAEDGGSGEDTTLQSTEEGPSGRLPPVPSWEFSKKRGKLGEKAPFAPTRKVQGESKDKMSTSWRIKKEKKRKKKSHPGWRCPFQSLFPSLSFGFPSPDAFNLLEEEEKVGAEEEGKRKRSLPRIKFVRASAGSRQWRAPRGLGESQQGPRTQKLLRRAGADTRTHTQPDHSLFPARVSLPARRLSCSPLSTPPPGCSVKQ